ncbi:MAG: hypothetical protein ACK57G_06775, partial [Planctomycetota bacterium]
DEPRQSPAYPDNLVVSKTLRGWYVLALDCVSLSGLGSRSLGSMSDGCHLPIPTTCSLAKRCVGGTYQPLAVRNSCGIKASPSPPGLLSPRRGEEG